MGTATVLVLVIMVMMIIQKYFHNVSNVSIQVNVVAVFRASILLIMSHWQATLHH